MKSAIFIATVGYLVLDGIAKPADKKLDVCQGICVFGTHADECDRCCKNNNLRNGHCGSAFGATCWCSGVSITTTTEEPTTTTIRTTTTPTTTLLPTTPTTTPLPTTPFPTTTSTAPTKGPRTTTSTSSTTLKTTTQETTTEFPSTTPKPSNGSEVWKILAGTITALVICVASIIYCWRRRKSVISPVDNNIEQSVCEENCVDEEATFRNINNGNYCILYKESHYSISPEEIEMDCSDPSKLLGEGKFGKIYQGKLLQRDGIDEPKWQNVAIKSVKQNSAAAYKKSLLDEMKILAYIGEHNNILKFLGYHTVTNENYIRDTFLILELCTNGNLKDFLSHNYSNFVSYIRGDKFFNNTMLNTQKILAGQSFSTKCLLDWSYQIACGMEFLSSKMIIHNDIAARNVLLTEDRTAKISDFGLSRAMDENNQCYIKKSIDMPIPWPWMAPESLKNYQFSIESDVWSYGVLLWEIFTLGDDPHANIIDDWELCTKLNDGYRLAKPNYSTCEIYLEILLCWRIAKSDRPKFEKLKLFFEKQSEALKRILEEPVKPTQISTQMCPGSSGKSSSSEMPSYLKFGTAK